MKLTLSVIILSSLVGSLSLGAEAPATTQPAPTTPAAIPLEEQLKTLELPGNQAPSVVSSEKLYVIQTRFLPLKFKNEFTLGIAQNLTGSSFFTTQQVEIGYRFHFSDRFSLGVAQAFVGNSMTPTGDQLLRNEGIAPNMAYARQRSEFTGEYNLFYGKFRLSAEQVFYFDQYVGLGPGLMMMNTGNVGAAVADVGFAFWLGKWGSARLGLKDYVYNEPDRTTAGLSHNLHGHLDLGYIF